MSENFGSPEADLFKVFFVLGDFFSFFCCDHFNDEEKEKKS